MTHTEKITDLYHNFIYAGKLMDGFEKYYADDVVMQELGEEPRKGKHINREREINFVSGIKEFHGGGILGIASDEAKGQTFVESWMDVTFSGGHRAKLQQVAIQKWEDGLIVSEIFYHK